MKTKTPLLLLAPLLCLAACSPKEKKEMPEEPTAYQYNPANYQGLPPGYGYMENTELLAEAVAIGDVSYVRQHGWKLWAAIWQPASGLNWPVWYTWPNTYDAFINPVSHVVGAGASGKMAKQQKTLSLILLNAQRTPGLVGDTIDTADVNIKDVPYYPIPQPVMDEYGNVIQDGNINIGQHFMSNGDIMIPTESYSLDGYNWILENNLNKQSTLNSLEQGGTKNLDAPQTYIVTKHMFWPVPSDQPALIPVWDQNAFPTDFTGYAGYETWQEFVAVDMSGQNPVGSTVTASYLYGVYTDQSMKTPLGPIAAQATVVDIGDFYYHQVTAEDWASFSEADQASLMAASYWAYNRPFQVNDYLVTVAMHINTKEIPTWAFQSVWWTNKPGTGKYSTDQPDLPQAQGPWKHYDLVDAYGIVDPATGDLPIGMNPYIELVIHPIATNCQNCHMRAGWPLGNTAGTASYQNPDCKELLEKLTPASPCLQQYMLTDMQWVIPDHAQ